MVSGFAIIADVSGPSAIISSSQDVSCNGGNDGGATVNVTDGIPPYSYMWIPTGQTTQTATDLYAGTYTAQVTDNFNCVTTVNVIINEPPPLVPTISSSYDASCYSSCDGNASVAVSGGTSPYTYSWNTSPLQTTNIAAGLCAGSYNVVVTDANSCIANASVNIIEPAPLSLSITETSANCYDSCDGSASASVNGGTPPYTYSWNTSPTQTNIIATGLCASTFTVSINDANGCIVVSTVIISEPSLLSVSISSYSDVDCYGICNGFAQSYTSGGTTPNTYLWSDGQTNAQATGLCQDVYSIIVTDNNGCIDSTSITINEPQQLVTSMTSNNVNCFDDCDGDATVSVSGGIPPYSYLWNDPGLQTSYTATGLCNGMFTATITDFNGCVTTHDIIITQPEELRLVDSTTSSTCGNPNGAACISIIGGVAPFTVVWNDPGNTVDTCIFNVPANVYNPIVTDGNGCTFSMPVLINDIAGPAIDTTTVTEVTCNGDSDGTATVASSGGTPPLTYVWRDGNGDTIGIGMTMDTILNLPGGIYTITVADSNGCIESNTVSIFEPTPLVSAIISSNNVTCFGYCNGSATVIAGGSIPSYNYLWDDPNSQTTTTATGLCEGNYIAQVFDLNGCETESPVSISQPDALAISPIVENVSCYEGGNGMITILTPTGGTPPYAYIWSPNIGNSAIVTNLIAGTYTVTVTDLKGCILVENILVNEPAPLIAQATSSPSSCGSANGEASVTFVGGGISPYTYQWNDFNNQTTSIATGLLADNYEVTVYDYNGCSITIPVTVNDNSGPVITLSFTPLICNGVTAGTATTTVISGDNPPFYFLWDDGQTSSTASGLSAGTISVTVTDLYNCVATGTVTVTEPDLLEVINYNDPEICYGENTPFYVMTLGGTGAYTYSWDNNLPDTNVHTVSPLITTIYNVTVTDANGCTASQSVTVTVKPPLSVTAPDVTICDSEDAFLSASGSGGDSSSYTFTWSNGYTGSAQTVPGLTNNTSFTVILSDNCSLNDTHLVAITVNPIPSAPIAGIDAEYCYGDPVTDLTAIGSNIEWFSDAGLTTLIGAGSSYTPFPGAGNNVYYATQTVINCQSPAADVVIAVYPIPQAEFVPVPDETPIVNPIITFTDLSTISSGSINEWEWDFDDNTSSIDQNTVHEYTNTGVYYVWLKVYSNNGCVDSIMHVVNIKHEYILFIPSAFSPNEDNKNDYFLPKIIGVNDKFEIYIYNRWGDVICEYSGQYDGWQGWDGKANDGQNFAQIGVYVWLIKITDLNGIEHEYVGHVTLIR
ncbi:MAG: gliding motility-associated C-terminal domain-containing protein [Bacteroidota bacterium]